MSHPVLFALAFVAAAGMGAEVRIRVSAGKRSHQQVPVSVVLPAAGTGGVEVVNAETATRVPCQWRREGGMVRVAWVVDSLAAGSECDYLVRYGAKAREHPRVVLKREGEGRLSFYVDGNLFTTYRFDRSLPYPCWYPLCDAAGRRLTRGFPLERLPREQTDHTWHRSLWLTFGNVNGANFWQRPSGRDGPRIVHRGFDVVEGGSVFGEMVARWDWLAEDGRRLMQSTVVFRVWPIRGARLVDLVATLRASDGPVRFGDTKEGMMALRVATPLAEVNTGRITDSRGRVGMRQVFGQRADWCDYSGRLGEAAVGIALFDHPANPRHPPRWFARHYGLLAANPFGDRGLTGNRTLDGSFELPRGRAVSFRYRLYLHEGDVEAARVGEFYGSYANPPKVRVLE